LQLAIPRPARPVRTGCIGGAPLLRRGQCGHDPLGLGPRHAPPHHEGTMQGPASTRRTAIFWLSLRCLISDQPISHTLLPYSEAVYLFATYTTFRRFCDAGRATSASCQPLNQSQYPALQGDTSVSSVKPPWSARVFWSFKT
jgi:hypothetical protein